MVKEKSTHFQTDWLPLAHTIVKTGQVFNWEDILAFNICLHMKNIPGMKKPCFYMSSYLVDVIVPPCNFLTLGGTGTKTNPLFMCTTLSSGALITRDIFMTFVIFSHPSTLYSFWFSKT
jgi:hypothetical protein